MGVVYNTPVQLLSMVGNWCWRCEAYKAQWMKVDLFSFPREATDEACHVWSGCVVSHCSAWYIVAPTQTFNPLSNYVYLAATWCKNLYVIWYPLVLYHHLASLCVLCVSFVWADSLLTQSWLLSVCIPSNTHPDNGLTTACAVYTVFTANWIEGQDLRGAAINSNIVVVNIHATKCWCKRYVVL